MLLKVNSVGRRTLMGRLKPGPKTLSAHLVVVLVVIFQAVELTAGEKNVS